jgi:hypothetical protein
MSPLQTQVNRLYRLQPEAGEPATDGLSEVGDLDGPVRGLALELARPADWDAMSLVWRGVQADFDLPAPAIAVNGVDGYQLWFSLAQAVPRVHALEFLEALRARYLGAIALARVRLMPQMPQGLPALQASTQHWSAFIKPDLAPIFSDEPWLDEPPNPEAQAQVLSQLVCTKPEAFARATAQLGKPVHAPMPLSAVDASASKAAPDPKRFLMDVMTDERVDMHLRIEAAKALLPYCEGGVGSNGVQVGN